MDYLILLKIRMLRILLFARTGVKIGRKKTRPSALIRRLRSKGLTFREIARLANCSQGSVSVEMREWETEKADGIEKNIEDEEITGELHEKMVNTPEINAEEIEIPPMPIQVVRY
jgi:hypothetical protein